MLLKPTTLVPFQAAKYKVLRRSNYNQSIGEFQLEEVLGCPKEGMLTSYGHNTKD